MSQPAFGRRGRPIDLLHIARGIWRGFVQRLWTRGVKRQCREASEISRCVGTSASVFREVERGGDVLVGAPVGHRDRAPEEAELVVGADEADELDLAALGPARGELGERARRTWL